MLVYRAVFESESAPGCILVLLLVTLSVVCSRAVLCAGCRLAGCIVRGLRELSRQNIARWWIYILLPAAFRAHLKTARACECCFVYRHEGASPKGRYRFTARRARKGPSSCKCDAARKARGEGIYPRSGAFRRDQ